MNVRHRIFPLASLFAVALLLSACSETEFVSHWAKKFNWTGQQESAGTYKIGNPYRVGSVWYYPHEDFNLVETGIASWYGPDFNHHRTANGEIYDQDELTAAHRTLQMPSLVRVTNLENGRSVVVRINDRGPYLHGRVIDVSKRAAELLGFIGRGTARVKLEVLPTESREIAEAARRGMDTSRLTMEDLQRYGQKGTTVASAAPQPQQRAPIVRGEQVASLNTESDSSSMPESLQTPTITVEQLSAPATAHSPAQWKEPDRSPPPRLQPRQASAPAQQSQPQTHQAFVQSLNLENDETAATVDNSIMAPGHMNKGHFMPDPVVTHQPVAPTGLFVQAGAFAVRANADRLKEKLSGLAPVVIEPVNVNGRQLYRVKLGPISNVEKADTVLEKVIAAGNGTAKVIHN